MRTLVALLCLFAVGCQGPLMTPIAERLDEEDQACVDQAWCNMFSPPGRLDHTLLLDVVLVAQLHQRGVDHLRLVSEKHVGDGLAVMEVRFDREDPSFDEFSLSYIDADGYETRRERYTREEIEDRIEFLFDIDLEVLRSDDSGDADNVCQVERDPRAAEREARFEEIQAAVQPTELP